MQRAKGWGEKVVAWSKRDPTTFDDKPSVIFLKGIGLRCRDGGLLSVRCSAKAAGHDALVDSIDLDAEGGGTGYRKKKGFFTPEIQADWHRLHASVSGRARDYRNDGGRVWRWFLRGPGTDEGAIGHS